MIDILENPNLPASVLTFKDEPFEMSGRLFANISMCGIHTDFTLPFLPVTEDNQTQCANCVRDAGYTYRVFLTYYRKDSGKFYSHGDYLTKKKWMYQIFEEFQDMLDAGMSPGLKTSSGYFITLEVPAHPHNHPYLFFGVNHD